jgi:hypothetical protein
MNPFRSRISACRILPSPRAAFGAVLRVAAGVALLGAFVCGAPALASVRCVVSDNGSGTSAFPPYAPPGYESADGVLLIRSGVPPTAPIIGKITLSNIVETLVTPGGSLGGTVHDFTCDLRIALRGTGGLSGLNRVFTIPATCRAAVAPITAFALTQSFAVDLLRIQGQIPPGDPDFDLLRFTGGTDFGMPSPGHTTLTRRPGGDWEVDSFFDITYRVDFVGHAGSLLGGMSGSTTAHARVQEGLTKPAACSIPSSLLTFPPSCVEGYVSDPNAVVALSGMPVGNPLTGKLVLGNFALIGEFPGSSLGGTVQHWTADVLLDMAGQGDLTYHRVLAIPVEGWTETGPRTPGAVVDGFSGELLSLIGQIPPGDPDFGLLRITSGDWFGYPSPGHTTLVQLPSGEYVIDSFFDITYRIDFAGAPGGVLAGMSGSDVNASRFQMGQQLAGVLCKAPDIGGTAQIPYSCSDGYVTPLGARVAVSGMPSGEPLLGRLALTNITAVAESPGGSLGGTTQTFITDVRMDIFGTGTLAGYVHTVVFTGVANTAAAPRALGTSPQSVPMEIIDLYGQLPPGDPDFDLLRISAGAGFGMPSPGHITLSKTGGGDWWVDSFFDITYRIDFIGAPGGVVAGRSGSTTAENRFKSAEFAKLAVPGDVPAAFRVGAPAPNPSRGGSSLALDLPARGAVRAGVYDVSGRRIALIENRVLEAGHHELRWNGRDDSGAMVSPGLYFFSVRANGAEIAKRVTLNR